MKKLARVLIVGIAVLGWSFAAAAKCPELAKVDWWTSTVPEVTKAVTTTYKGDWDAYIARWKKHRADLQSEYDLGGSVEIKSRKRVFIGDDLKAYIAMVDERIAALDCLKREIGDRELASFATAAGGQQPVQEPIQVAKIVEQDLAIDIVPTCTNGVAAFQVTNRGERWPRLAQVSLFRTDTNGKLTQRRVRMINGQQMLFKVPAQEADGVGEVAIYIEPTWYERKFAYDARLKC